MSDGKSSGQTILGDDSPKQENNQINFALPTIKILKHF